MQEHFASNARMVKVAITGQSADYQVVVQVSGQSSNKCGMKPGKKS